MARRIARINVGEFDKLSNKKNKFFVSLMPIRKFDYRCHVRNHFLFLWSNFFVGIALIFLLL